MVERNGCNYSEEIRSIVQDCVFQPIFLVFFVERRGCGYSGQICGEDQCPISRVNSPHPPHCIASFWTKTITKTKTKRCIIPIAFLYPCFNQFSMTIAITKTKTKAKAKAKTKRKAKTKTKTMRNKRKKKH